jgi:hypothetical protein
MDEGLRLAKELYDIARSEGMHSVAFQTTRESLFDIMKKDASSWKNWFGLHNSLDGARWECVYGIGPGSRRALAAPSTNPNESMNYVLKHVEKILGVSLLSAISQVSAFLNKQGEELAASLSGDRLRTGSATKRKRRPRKGTDSTDAAGLFGSPPVPPSQAAAASNSAKQCVYVEWGNNSCYVDVVFPIFLSLSSLLRKLGGELPEWFPISHDEGGAPTEVAFLKFERSYWTEMQLEKPDKARLSSFRDAFRGNMWLYVKDGSAEGYGTYTDQFGQFPVLQYFHLCFNNIFLHDRIMFASLMLQDNC